MTENKPSTRHTCGPYESKANNGGPSIEITSSTTGEVIATVYGRHEKSQKNVPESETALHNAAMFRRAPEMKAALESILENQHEPIDPVQAQSIRGLLSEMAFADRKEIRESIREYDRKLDEHLRNYRPGGYSFKITSATVSDLEVEPADQQQDEPQMEW